MSLQITKQKAKEVRLGTYPYTYARISCMKTTLLKKEDYARLMKMTPNEIIEFLQETTYRKEINELAIKYSGTQLVEIALNRNLEDVFAKLRRISKPELVRVIDTYLMRYDFENIKTVLRAKYTKSEGEAEDLLIAAGCLRRPFFLKLLKEESIEAALEKNCLVDFKKIKQAYDKFKNSNVLGEIENAFDAEYYSYLFGLATKIPKQGKQFRDFLESELEVVNIMNVFRLKRAGVSKADALSYLLPVSRVMKQKLTKLLDAEISEAQTIFLMTPYAKLVEEGLESLQRTGSLIEMETKLKSYLLKKTTMLIREHPLSVDVILGYMFAKDMEVRNLKLMLKGKQLGLDDAFIESQLVV